MRIKKIMQGCKYTPSQRQFVRQIIDLKNSKRLAKKSYLKCEEKLNTDLTPKERKITTIWKNKAYTKYQTCEIRIKALQQRCVELGIPYGI